MNPKLRTSLVNQLITSVYDNLDREMICEILDQSYGFSKMSDDELMAVAAETGIESLSFTLSAIIEHLEKIGWSGGLIDILQEIVIDLDNGGN